MKFIDLFAGIGGFRYGLEKCNDKNRQSDNYTCIWSNEWDKYASSIYKKHYGKCDTRDIAKVPSSEIPDHDLLVGGFPCQPFSIAGKRRGFNDTRGTLFFEIVRVLRDKRPRYFLLENVKGLLSNEGGKTFQTILRVLTDLGYECQWQVLNSKNFGVPQNRERVFIVGNLRGTPRPKVFPVGGTGEVRNKPISDKETVCQTIKARYPSDWNGNYLEYLGGVVGKRDMWLKDGKKNSRNFSQGQRVYGIGGISSTLAGNAGGLGGKTGLYATRIPLKFLNRNQKNIEGDYSFTVDGANTGGIRQGMKIRRLTPTECERLQGFPDGWTEFGIEGKISDAQRYKVLGNAVTTNVVTFIGKRLLRS